MGHVGIVSKIPRRLHIPCELRTYECLTGLRYRVLTSLWVVFIFLYVCMIQVGSLWLSDCECHHTSPCKSGVMHHMAVAVLLDRGSEVSGSIVASNVLDLGTHHVDRSDSASIQYRSQCNALCKAIGVYSEYPEQLAGTCFGCWRIIRLILRW